MILDQLKSKMVEYIKAKDAERLDVIRFFLAKIKNREIELRPQNVTLNDEHVFKVYKKLVKQLDETIDICTKANKQEALAQAQKEKALMFEFEPLFPAEMIQADKLAQEKYQQFQKKS
jgi:uncharacterized protein YqeY